MTKSKLKKPSDKKDVFGAFLVENAQFTLGKYDMPIVRSNVDELPSALFSYQRAGSNQKEIASGTALHFYVYDYLFDGEYGVWNSLIRGVEFKRGFNLNKLERFDYIITPDYSLNGDMPIEWQIWNVYRSRVVTIALQELGYKVIVNVRWAYEESFDFCFAGIDKGSIVAVGSYGCSKNWTDKNLFDDGLNELIIRVKPKAIIIYGTLTDSAKVILKKHNQDYIVFRSDTDVAMEESHHGNEG
ncbi:MAG: DUF4417 domain-containing protein [Erysipelotrichaceae bacterium]|nr:DUF4417 domain-containing protein [Erysipelotrichaceae bacterium]